MARSAPAVEPRRPSPLEWLRDDGFWRQVTINILSGVGIVLATYVGAIVLGYAATREVQLAMFNGIIVLFNFALLAGGAWILVDVFKYGLVWRGKRWLPIAAGAAVFAFGVLYAISIEEEWREAANFLTFLFG